MFCEVVDSVISLKQQKVTVNWGGIDSPTGRFRIYVAVNRAPTNTDPYQITTGEYNSSSDDYIYDFNLAGVARKRGDEIRFGVGPDPGTIKCTNSYTTLKINTEPTVRIESDFNQVPNSENGYSISSNLQVVAGQDGFRKGTFTLRLYYRYNSGANFSNWTQKTLDLDQTTLKKAIKDIRSLIPISGNYSKCYYYFEAIRNDSLEDSPPFKTSTYFFNFPPRMLKVTNTLNFLNGDTKDKRVYFSNRLLFNFDLDYGYDKVNIELINLSTKKTYKKESRLTVREKSLYCDYSYENLPSGEYEASYYFVFSNISSPVYGFATPLYRVEKNLKNFELANKSFTVYGDRRSLMVSFLKENMRKYGIDVENNPIFCYAKLTAEGQSGQEISLINKNFENNSTYFYGTDNLVANDDFFPKVGYNKVIYGVLDITIRNIFGEATVYSFKNIEINRCSIPILDIESFTIDGINFDEWIQGNYLIEGVPLTLKGRILTYNTSPKLTFYFLKGKETNMFNKDTPELKFISKDKTDLSIYSFSTTFIIKEIREGEISAIFKAYVTTDAPNGYYLEEVVKKNITLQGHTANTVTRITDVIFDNDTKLTLLFQFDSLGALNTNNDLQIKIQLQERLLKDTQFTTVSGEDKYQKILDGENTYSKENYSLGTNDAKVIRLKITTRKFKEYNNRIYQSEKVSYSKERVVYNTVPTVAYRKNCLGINTLNPNSSDYPNSLVVINANEKDGSKKSIIYLMGLDHPIKIDLENGTVDGLVINCGTW